MGDVVFTIIGFYGLFGAFIALSVFKDVLCMKPFSNEVYGELRWDSRFKKHVVHMDDHDL